MLKHDLRRVIAALDQDLPFFGALNAPRKRALVNMRFQLGVHGLMQFTGMLDAIAREDWQQARNEALDSAWARQTPERAARVADRLFSGID